ncbi:MAG: hypothetical protein EBX70_09110 [Betaproteobacteria bacterium]|nr:hypothetical protein [Betaproteobacteria bacterium]
MGACFALVASGGGASGLFAQTREPLKIKGQVKVDGKPIASQQQIRSGQSVTVSPGGSVAFAVGDDAFILKGQERGANLHIEGKASSVDQLRLVSGGLVAAFGKGAERKIVTTIFAERDYIRYASIRATKTPAKIPHPKGCQAIE